MDRTLSGVTNPGQNGPGIECHGRVFPISQSITRTLPSYCLELYPGPPLGGVYRSAEMQSVYSIAPTDLAKNKSDDGVSVLEFDQCEVSYH